MKHTILLVEDNPADCALIRRAFEKAKLSAGLFRAKDGDDAVDYLDGSGDYQDRVQHPLPSLILLDIKLPRRSGFEVLSWIRRDPRPLRRMPVVMLTSSRHSVDINRAFELGANAYTVKPDTNAELVELLESIKHFWLQTNEFPVTAADTSAAANAQRPPLVSSERTILLIEDERTDALLTTRALTKAGFEGKVDHAQDARTALEMLARAGLTGKLPSVILLDLKLPGMSGFEFLDTLRRSPGLKQIPVVVLAGAHDSETVNRAYERGANSYLVKSPHPDEVTRLMLFMQQYWLTMNQSAFGQNPRAPRDRHV